MVTTIITGFGHVLVLVRRRVHEELKVCAVTATQCTYLAVRLRMDVEIVIRAPRWVQRIDHLAAKHIHEKLRSLIEIGYRQPNVFDATHAGEATFAGSRYIVRFHRFFLQTSGLAGLVKSGCCCLSSANPKRGHQANNPPFVLAAAPPETLFVTIQD